MLAISATTDQLVLGKCARPLGDESSPKKLKMALSLRRTTLEVASLGFQAISQEVVPMKRK